MGSEPVFGHGRPLTRQDLESISDDGHRHELVDGVLLMSPSPRPLHQRVVARLLAALGPGCPRDWEVLPAPVDVVLADDTVLIPDIVLARRTDLTDRALLGVPVLAIEVISPSSRLIDTQLKWQRLAEAGCPHYWLVEPDRPELRCLALQDGRYAESAAATGADSITVAEPYPVTLSPSRLVAEH
jgi:Uma2 family endonuclease